MTAKPHYVSETTQLHEVANDARVRIVYRAHALMRMTERHVDRLDVWRVLKTGSVVLVDHKKEDEWRVAGRDLDAREIELVVVVYEDELVIKLITVLTPRDDGG